MWVVHMVVGAGWVVDLAATVVAGTAAYLATYLVVGLTPVERRGAASLLERFPIPFLRGARRPSPPTPPSPPE
jgi:hypothetical protein